MPHEPIVVRPATIDDIPFLRAMMRVALLASPTFVAHQDMDAIQQAEEREWLNWREHPTPAFVAVDADGRSLGAVRLRPHDSAEGQGWQLGIGIVAGARNQGIGRRLMEQTITYARATGAAYIYLMVDPDNAPAIALYRRTGFVEIGEREHVIGMRLDLERDMNSSQLP